MLLTTVLLLLCSNSNYAFAEEANYFFTAKTAHIKDVDKYGSNLLNDIADNNSNTANDTQFRIVQNSNSIHINGMVGNDDIEIYGEACATTENEKVIYFSSNCSSNNYEVVNLTYEMNISDSVVYFKGYRSNNQDVKTVLKIYLKSNEKLSSNDYYIFEVFNFQLDNAQSIINSIRGNDEPIRWNTCFLPISIKEEETYAPNAAYTTEKTISETWNNMGQSEIHTITFSMNYDYTDVPRSGNASQKYTLKIVGKTARVVGASNYISSDKSNLHIRGLTLRSATIPNTAFYSTKIDGLVKKIGTIGGALSASIGFSKGPLSISLEIPSFFSYGGSVDINETYTSYENNVNGEYVKAVEVAMDSNYMLKDINDKFMVENTIRDYGNISTNYGNLSTRWYIDIISYNNLGESSYSYPQSVAIKVL